MTEPPADPLDFANDDPLRRALDRNDEFWRIQELARTDPEQADVELERLLGQIKREKAARGEQK